MLSRDSSRSCSHRWSCQLQPSTEGWVSLLQCLWELWKLESVRPASPVRSGHSALTQFLCSSMVKQGWTLICCPVSTTGWQGLGTVARMDSLWHSRAFIYHSSGSGKASFPDLIRWHVLSAGSCLLTPPLGPVSYMWSIGLHQIACKMLAKAYPDPALHKSTSLSVKHLFFASVQPEGWQIGLLTMQCALAHTSPLLLV